MLILQATGDTDRQCYLLTPGEQSHTKTNSLSNVM